MKGCILPFSKKSDLGLAKNCQGISLTSIAAKIYNALQHKRIEPKIDNILRKNQNGFRRNRLRASSIDKIKENGFVLSKKEAEGNPQKQIPTPTTPMT